MLSLEQRLIDENKNPIRLANEPTVQIETTLTQWYTAGQFLCLFEGTTDYLYYNPRLKQYLKHPFKIKSLDGKGQAYQYYCFLKNSNHYPEVILFVDKDHDDTDQQTKYPSLCKTQKQPVKVYCTPYYTMENYFTQIGVVKAYFDGKVLLDSHIAMGSTNPWNTTKVLSLFEAIHQQYVAALQEIYAAYLFDKQNNPNLTMPLSPFNYIDINHLDPQKLNIFTESSKTKPVYVKWLDGKKDELEAMKTQNQAYLTFYDTVMTNYHQNEHALISGKDLSKVYLKFFKQLSKHYPVQKMRSVLKSYSLSKITDLEPYAFEPACLVRFLQQI